MSQLTKQQQDSQAKADAMGREFMTTIDGRIAIILRPAPEENVADRISKIAQAVERVAALPVAGLVVLERMPDHFRGSHRAAGNWGSYPHNGAERAVVSREWAAQTVEEDEDGYDHIVRDATDDDVSCYGRGD